MIEARTDFMGLSAVKVGSFSGAKLWVFGMTKLGGWAPRIWIASG